MCRNGRRLLLHSLLKAGDPWPGVINLSLFTHNSKLLASDPGANRTRNLQLRRLLLYPIELRGHCSTLAPRSPELVEGLRIWVHALRPSRYGRNYSSSPAHPQPPQMPRAPGNRTFNIPLSPNRSNEGKDQGRGKTRGQLFVQNHLVGGDTSCQGDWILRLPK